MTRRTKPKPRPQPGDRGKARREGISGLAWAEEGREANDRPHPAWLALIVLAAGLAVYANSFKGGFVFDDEVWILDNQRIRTLWPGWDALVHGQRPVVNLTLAINYAIGELHPWGYHLVNVAVHLLAGLTLFGVVRRSLLKLRPETLWHRRPAGATTGETPVPQPPLGCTLSTVSTEPRGRSASWLALAVALIWTLHPLQTQSVNYVIQRSESLMGLFYLLTLYCVIRGAGATRPTWWYVAAVMACALGMGSKAIMVTAPVVLLLYDRVFLVGSAGEMLRRRWGLYAGLAATWLVLAVVGVIPGVLNPSAARAGVGFGYKGVTPLEYAMTQPEVIVHYLKLAFWPRWLCLDYGWPVAESVRQIIIPAVVVVGLLGGTVWALLKRPRLGFVGAWFFIVLAPTSSIIPIKDLAFEHRMYLSLAAVVVAVVLGGQAALGLVGGRWGVTQNVRRSVGGFLLVLVVVALGVRTVLRNRDYQRPAAMWAGVIEKYPDSARAHHNLGHELGKEGNGAEAILQYREALRLNPDLADTHHSLGFELAKLGRYDEAVACYEEALRLRPDYLEARNNLAVALAELGRTDQAIESYRQAARQSPNFPEAQYNLGRELAKLGRAEEAVACYHKALQLKPDFADAHNALGIALVRQGQVDEAVVHYQRAIALQPDYANAYDNLGNAFLMKGRFDEAIAHCSEALRLAPDSPEAHANLGIALAQRGRVDEAIAHLTEAVRLKPAMASAHKNLGVLLADGGRLDEAISHFRQTIDLRPDDVATRYALGEALLRRGEFDQAANEFQEVLRVNPRHPDAPKMLDAARSRRPP